MSTINNSDGVSDTLVTAVEREIKRGKLLRVNTHEECSERAVKRLQKKSKKVKRRRSGETRSARRKRKKSEHKSQQKEELTYSPRFVQLAIPKPEHVYHTWTNFEDVLEPERVFRLQETFVQKERISPEDARNYFKRLDAKKKKILRKKQQKKKQENASKPQLKVVYNIADVFVERIIDYFLTRPLASTNLKSTIIADALMKKFRRIESPDTEKNNEQYMTAVRDIVDQFAMWIDTKVNFSNMFAFPRLPYHSVQFPEFISPDAKLQKIDIEGPPHRLSQKSVMSHAKSSVRERKKRVKKPKDDGITVIKEADSSFSAGMDYEGSFDDEAELIEELDSSLSAHISADSTNELQTSEDDNMEMNEQEIIDETESEIVENNTDEIVEEKSIEEEAVQEEEKEITEEIIESVREEIAAKEFIVEEIADEEGAEEETADEETAEEETVEEEIVYEETEEENVEEESVDEESVEEEFIVEETVDEDPDEHFEIEPTETEEELAEVAVEDTKSIKLVSDSKMELQNSILHMIFSSLHLPPESEVLPSEGSEKSITAEFIKKEMSEEMDARESFEEYAPEEESLSVKEHVPGTVCCVCMKTWASWLADVTRNNHTWCEWIHKTVLQIKRYAAFVKGGRADNQSGKLYKEDWVIFKEAVNKELDAWNKYNVTVMDYSKQIVNHFDEKTQPFCPLCLETKMIIDKSIALKINERLIETLKTVTSWREGINKAVLETGRLSSFDISPATKIPSTESKKVIHKSNGDDIDTASFWKVNIVESTQTLYILEEL